MKSLFDIAFEADTQRRKAEEEKLAAEKQARDQEINQFNEALKNAPSVILSLRQSEPFFDRYMKDAARLELTRTEPDFSKMFPQRTPPLPPPEILVLTGFEVEEEYFGHFTQRSSTEKRHPMLALYTDHEGSSLRMYIQEYKKVYGHCWEHKDIYFSFPRMREAVKALADPTKAMHILFAHRRPIHVLVDG